MSKEASVSEILADHDEVLRQVFAKLIRRNLDHHDHHIYWNRENNTLFCSPNNPPSGPFDPVSEEFCVNVFTMTGGDLSFIELGGEAGDDDLVDDDYINESSFDRFVSKIEDGMYGAELELASFN